MEYKNLVCLVACFFAGSTVDYAMIENGMINMTLFFKVLLMYFPIGFFLAFVFASQLKFDKAEDSDDEEEEIKFEDKYPIDSIEDTVNDDVKENNYIMGNTPDGNVIMSWNNYKESFQYWSDSSIKFDYLETIARKYVKSYYCKNIYICRKKELEKQKQKIKEKDENEKMKDEDKKDNNSNDDVFAKLKTNLEKKYENKKKMLENLAPINGNKFSKIGKINECPVFKKIEVKNRINIDKKKENLSFSAFKRFGF